MSRDTIPIYGGAIKANKVQSFERGGETFHIIRPGYCIQGKRRTGWTQIVHEDIPIHSVKADVKLDEVVKRFDDLWAKYVGDDAVVLIKSLEASKREHRRKFRDGQTGEPPAPTLTKDERAAGKRYGS